MKKHTISPLQKSLNLWAVILLVWGAYRYFFKAELPIWFDEFIAKPIVFIGPIYYYITQVEKRKFAEGIDFHGKTLGRDLALGLIIGVFFFITNALGSISSFQTLLSKIPHILTSGQFLGLGVIAIATSITEETLSRGFILKRLYDSSKNVVTSSLIASVLFFFLHIPFLLTSEKLMGPVLLQVMATDLLLSFSVSLLFLYSRSLMVPIIVHALYSISIYFFHFALS